MNIFVIIKHFFLSLKPIDVLQKFKDELVSEKMATVESAKAYLEMLRTFRHAGKETIAEVLTSQDGYYIVWVGIRLHIRNRSCY